jgi:hypothetical protein
MVWEKGRRVDEVHRVGPWLSEAGHREIKTHVLQEDAGRVKCTPALSPTSRRSHQVSELLHCFDRFELTLTDDIGFLESHDHSLVHQHSVKQVPT